MPPIGNRRSVAQTGVLAGAANVWQPCLLTWYDPALGGTNSASGKPDPNSRTSSGEPYDPNAYTCAAPPKYPFGTEITFQVGQTAITCRVNDRGGAISGNHFDLSRAAARALGIIGAGRANGNFQVGKLAGAPAAANDQVNPVSSSSSQSFKPTSILDLLTQPTNALGGWLAEIAVNLLKDTVIGVADVVIIPFWHWNQRAAYDYQTKMFARDTSQGVGDSTKRLLWTAAFWGGGYWLLFTDPTQGNLKPVPVRNSRAARHARFAQSLPARKRLVKPKDVKSRTATKPKSIISRAVVTQTGTMRAIRHQTVKVEGTHARTDVGSETRVEREGTLTPAGESANAANARPRPTLPDAEHRTGTRSLPGSGGRSERRSGSSTGSRN